MSARRLGRYEIQEELGRGGTAAVFRARDEHLGIEVAVKVLGPAATRTEDADARFEREARAALAVQHPGLARLLDVGAEGPTRYMVFELLAGGTLRDRLAREGRLDWREAASHGAAVARALGALHRAGFVHRDVKPANVLLDREGRPKLADFGLARTQSRDDSITRAGEVSGTLEFLSPEQADGGPGDARSDLYGLGALLFTLVTGRPPFEGSGFPILKRVLTEMPRDVRAAAPFVPAAFARLVARLLAKEPLARGESAESVAAELEALIAPRPSRAPLAVGAALAGVGAILAAAALAAPRRQAVAAPPPTAVVRAEALATVADWGAPGLSHASPVTAVAFVGTGRVLAGDEEGQLALWDLASREKVAVLRAMGPKVTSISVQGDVAAVADQGIVGQGGSVRVWDLRARRVLATWRSEVAEPRVAIDPDGRHCAYTFASGLVGLVEVGSDVITTTGAREFKDQAVQGLACAADGRTFVALDRDIFAATRSSSAQKPSFHVTAKSPVRSFAVSPRTSSIAFGHVTGWLTVAEVPWVNDRTWAAHEGEAVAAIAFTPDGERLVSAGGGPGRRTLKVWARESGTLLRELRGHTGAGVPAVSVGPDGRTAVTAGSDGSIGHWDLERGVELGRDPRGHRSAVAAIAVTEDGLYGVSVGEDSCAKVWRTEDGGLVAPLDRAERGPYAAVAFAPGTRRARLLHAYGGVDQLEAGTEGWPPAPHVPGAQGPHLLASGGPGQIFEARAKALARHELERNTLVGLGDLESEPTALAFARPRVLLAGDATGALVFFDADARARLATVVADPAGVLAVAASDDGSLALTGGGSGELAVWDVKTSRVRARFALHAGAIPALAFASRDGRLAVVATEDDRAVRLLEVATGRELARTSFAATRDAPTCLAVSKDKVFVGTARGVVRKLEVRE